MTNHAKLPLRSVTPRTWADEVLRHPLALLNDHAHLEKKAAANALELLNRWPEPIPPPYWVEKMTAVARDEVDHLAIVTRLLARRGGRLTKGHRNPYAQALHKRVRRGRGLAELMDRLMVSALIEARSCERFQVLAAACDDDELSRLYGDLWASEHGHYRIFIDLSRQLPGVRAEAVDTRWDDWLDAEATILAAQSPGPRMHSAAPTGT